MPWALVSIGLCFAGFGLLARVSPCNPGQPRFVTRELADNALYWLFALVFYGGVVSFLVRTTVDAAFQGHAQAALRAVAAGYGWAARPPLAVQAALILLFMDFAQYWLHRAFHGRALWPFHAVHHSAREVDWTTAFRVHPVNFLIYSAAVAALIKLLGFSPAAIAIVATVNFVMGALVHANLNWTFGPLRYVVASPVYHRWHHALDPAARDKNFAPNFPFFDLMFGTFHMPKGELPQVYGAEDVPGHFLLQMIHPFMAIARRLSIRPAAA
jgi:sterol desaturase/sphingolipid hydroxylase (fatty acid hydroxylase superfamily)